ncbi:Uncharacterised protein [Mycobacteroides abscessus subsp. abscessus]|nr:Uncharacterised protein [Mycobacteroides abscessus subsp. abscessus]
MNPSTEMTCTSNGLSTVPSSSRNLFNVANSSSRSSVPPPCIQPSHRAARRSAASAWPPTRIGMGAVGAGHILVLGMS